MNKIEAQKQLDVVLLTIGHMIYDASMDDETSLSEFMESLEGAGLIEKFLGMAIVYHQVIDYENDCEETKTETKTEITTESKTT